MSHLARRLFELNSRLQTEETDILELQNTIEILTQKIDCKRQLLNVIQEQRHNLLDITTHPVYCIVSEYLTPDLSLIIVDYLNYKYCSKCCEIYYGKECLSHAKKMLIDFNSVGYILSGPNDLNKGIIISTDENENDYLNYIKNYHIFPEPYHLTIYDIGTKLEVKNTHYSKFNGRVIKTSSYIFDGSNLSYDFIKQVVERMLNPTGQLTRQVTKIELNYINRLYYSRVRIAYDQLEYVNDEYRIWTINTITVRFNKADELKVFNLEDFVASFKAVSFRCLQDDCVRSILNTRLPENFKLLDGHRQYHTCQNYCELFNCIGFTSCEFEGRKFRLHPTSLGLLSSYKDGVYYCQYS